MIDGQIEYRRHRDGTELREFIDCVLNNKTPPVTGRDGRLAVVLGLAAIKSCKENHPVRPSEIS